MIKAVCPNSGSGRIRAESHIAWLNAPNVVTRMQPISKKTITNGTKIPPFDVAFFQLCSDAIVRPWPELNEQEKRMIEIKKRVHKEYFINVLKIEYVDFECAYIAYLNSSAWKEKQATILKRDNNMCTYCCSSPATQVHHISYQNLGNESDFELISVCAGCHRIHATQMATSKKQRLAI